MQEKPQDQALARRIATLRTMPVFADLAERDLASLAEDMRSKEYAKDETIFRQGDESREVYFVRKGKVRIYKISPSGNETTIAIFTTNDVIGELAAIDQEPRSASAKAMTAVSLLAMSQERFLVHAADAAAIWHGDGTPVGTQAALDRSVCRVNCPV